MVILFDDVTLAGIARFLAARTVTKAKDRGWDTLTNGVCLAEASACSSLQDRRVSSLITLDMKHGKHHMPGLTALRPPATLAYGNESLA
jgi:hypothetical protein